MNDLLARLHARGDAPATEQWRASGTAFACSSERIEKRYDQATRVLFECIKPTEVTGPILHEGGPYHGCWLESTGTINTELMARFLPEVATATYTAFADHQRDDGLIPYKITAAGAAFSQIQLVTPLARSVWNHYRLNACDKDFLARMYAAMSRYDDWLAKYRNTLGSGGVEAFCTYDTGHDLSSRFWHVPDSPLNNDARTVHTDNPSLPFISPDLTANVACQRSYLARIAEELGHDGRPWRDRTDASLKALFEHCYCAEDHFFYDRDRNGKLVHVQSDVLLRVLACEVGDGDFFATALDRYLLNTSKFFAKYPFTSLALDDPRFDANFGQNSWNGPSNFLSIIRAAHAFEHHNCHVELSWAQNPILAALFDIETFPQTLSPFTGAAGYTDAYAPAILCLLDFVERRSGILPRPDGTLWFTGLIPEDVAHKDARHQTAYRRDVDGVRFELLNTGTTVTVLRDGQVLYRLPYGVRIATDRSGNPKSLTGMLARTVSGVMATPDGDIDISLGPNEIWTVINGRFVPSRLPSLASISYI
jgi:hypothetical protein